jgi:hypothetical protein
MSASLQTVPGLQPHTMKRALLILLAFCAVAAPVGAFAQFPPKRFALEDGKLVAYTGTGRHAVSRIDVSCDTARVQLSGASTLLLHGSFCRGRTPIVERLNAALHR